jgi:hypothetical protein
LIDRDCCVRYQFVWDEQSLEDVDSMLAFMLCGGFIVTMFMLLYALFDSQGATRLQYVPLSTAT